MLPREPSRCHSAAVTDTLGEFWKTYELKHAYRKSGRGLIKYLAERFKISMNLEPRK